MYDKFSTIGLTHVCFENFEMQEEDVKKDDDPDEDDEDEIMTIKLPPKASLTKEEATKMAGEILLWYRPLHGKKWQLLSLYILCHTISMLQSNYKS